MRRTLGILASLATLVAIVLTVHGLGFQSEAMTLRGIFGDFIEFDRRHLALGLTLGFTLLGGWLVGELVAPLGLPRMSGFLVFGLVFGPSAAAIGGSGTEALIPTAHRGALRAVDALAISLIALMAGGELQLRTVRRSFRAAIGTTTAEVLLVFLPIAVAIGLLGTRFGPLAGLAPIEVWFVASVAGLLAVGNSPAIVIAVLKETRARGPMRDTVLTTTITKDLLQIVVAAMLFAAGAALVVTDGDAAGAAGIASLLWHLLGSLGIGVAIGFASAWLVDHAGDRIGLVTAGMGVAVAAIAEAGGVSPLLTGLAAGLVLANLWPERTARMFRSMQDVFLPVSVIFFANAGASIDLVQLASVWPLALGLVTIRLVLMRSAVTAGMRWARVPEPAAGLAWTGFIAQAGVSLALAREFESAFAGSSFTGVVTTLLVAMIAFHEAIGPPIFAWGLRRAGEVPKDDA